MKNHLGITLAFLLLPVVQAFTLNPESIAVLSAGDQAGWKAYLERSEASATADQSALQVELAKHHLQDALPAPEGGDFELSEGAGAVWFASDEATALADVVISYQTPAGGWSKHTGYSKGPRKPGMLWSSQYQPGSKPHYLGTFDNHSTTQQIRLLSGVATATKRQDCQQAAIRGFDYILSSQFPNGSWPQVWPLEGGYHDAATFNDDATASILRLLHEAGAGKPEFAFLDEQRFTSIKAALVKGISFVVHSQVTLNGMKSGWCAQHDPLTLQPVAARAMEPASLASVETSNMVKFLMTIHHPEPELVSCVSSALQWLETAKITGISRVKREGKTQYEPSPDATEVYWSRFYSLSDGKPIFPGRDGVIYQSYSEMAARNKVGYDYYSTRPGSTVGSSQKKWRKMLASAK